MRSAAIQRKNGKRIQKPKQINGSLAVDHDALVGFDEKDNCIIDVSVTNFSISADGIMIKGIEDTGNDTLTYQEIWFIPENKK